MIWIYEHLSKAEIKKLEYLNPLMDYIKNNTDHLFNTHCTRLEIRDGQVQDVRKAKFFKVDQTKKGFICDKFVEAMDLSLLITNGEDFEESLLEDIPSEELLTNMYPDLLPYIQKRKLFGDFEWIAIPVNNFIEQCAQGHRKHLLDHLDLNLLKEYGIKYSKHIKRKAFEPPI